VQSESGSRLRNPGLQVPFDRAAIAVETAQEFVNAVDALFAAPSV